LVLGKNLVLSLIWVWLASSGLAKGRAGRRAALYAFMVDLSVDATVATVLKSRRRSIFGRIGNWLFSQRHFHLKLLSGTTVGVIVIIFLAGVFLLVTLRKLY